MAKPKRSRPDAAAERRRQKRGAGRSPGAERPRVQAPPGFEEGSLAFPWASALTIGWGSPDAVGTEPRRNRPAPRSRRRVAE